MKTDAKQVIAAMRVHRRHCAPDSECPAWQDFAAEFLANHGISPWNSGAVDVSISTEWESYWLHVAEGYCEPNDRPD